MLKRTSTELQQAAIGARIRQLRQAAEMTLATVAKRSGISAATLSKIENDKVSPTFANLLKLADAFEMPLARLIGGADPAPPTTARVAITRREDVKFTRTQTYDMGALCAELRNKRMSPFLDRVHASGPNVGDRLVQHAGEEFVYVLDGVLEIHTEHYQPIRLRKGDSAYFDSSMAHAYRADGDGPAEMLMVWLGPEGSTSEEGLKVVRDIALLTAERVVEPEPEPEPAAEPARMRSARPGRPRKRARA